jgi:serralysin
VSLLPGDIVQLAIGDERDRLVGVERIVFDLGTDETADAVTLGVLVALDAGNVATTWLLHNKPTFKANGLNGTAIADEINGLEGDDVITGGAGNDTLTGGAGNDTLNGGEGNDSLAGGTGNDIYIVDSLEDTITEVAGQGTDTVRTALGSLSLADKANVERLEYIGTDGSFEGTGNERPNTLVGGAGNDTLNGGTGADTMIGGAGDDTYIVDLAGSSSVAEDGSVIVIPGDTVQERTAQGADPGGNDTVKSSVTYTLVLNVENLILTGEKNIGGTGNIKDNTITGNAFNNALNGGAGSDTLLGGDGEDRLAGGAGNDFLNGGAGTDTLTGNAGVDRFIFDNLVTFDRVVDFTGSTASAAAQAAGVDRIALGADAFAALEWANGVLSDGQFETVTITTAATAGMHLVYNSKTGELFYDADGVGAGNAEVLVAILGTATHPALVAADFMQA